MSPIESLKQARLNAGLSLSEAAALMGTTRQNLWMVEEGRRAASLEWLYDAAVALKVNPNAIDPRLVRSVRRTAVRPGP